MQYLSFDPYGREKTGEEAGERGGCEIPELRLFCLPYKYGSSYNFHISYLYHTGIYLRSLRIQKLIRGTHNAQHVVPYMYGFNVQNYDVPHTGSGT